VGSGGVGGQGAQSDVRAITERSTSQIADVLRLTHDEEDESAHDRRDDRAQRRVSCAQSARRPRRSGPYRPRGAATRLSPILPNTSGCAGVLGCGWGGGARLGLVGDLGFGGGSGGCCVGSWACVVFPGAVGCCGGVVELVADVDLVVEQDWGLTGDVGASGQFGNAYGHIRTVLASARSQGLTRPGQALAGAAGGLLAWSRRTSAQGPQRGPGRALPTEVMRQLCDGLP